MKSRIETKIARAEVISFDVFDTAILRPLARPDDLFALMQDAVVRILGGRACVFRSARIEAEHMARARAWEKGQVDEVSLEEIYASLGELLDADAAALQQISALEIEAEKAICRQNPFIQSLYRRCLEQHKRVAFISDTYLPERVIDDLLRRCGYDAYDALLVSSALGKAKWTGRVYAEALSRFPCPPRRWLHIGDNPHADIYRARERGIATWHYEPCVRRFARNPSAAAWKEALPSTPAASVVQGLIANKLADARTLSKRISEQQSFWESFGYAVAGPLYVGFTEWLIEQATERDLQALYFLARDGLIMRRVYQALAPDGLETHYLYASRRVFNFAAIEAIDEKALRFLMDNRLVLAPAEYLQRLGLDWREHSDALRAAGFDDPHRKLFKSREQLRLPKLFTSLEGPICERARQERAILLEYLHHSGLRNGRRIGLVDIGWHGSMQKSIVELLAAKGEKPQITGFYLGSTGRFLHRPQYAHDAYLFRLAEPREYRDMIATSVEVVELLFSATEGSVLHIERDANGDFVPVRQLDDFDEYRNACIETMQEAAMQFVEDYAALKQSFPALSISRQTAVAGLNRVLRHPSRMEARMLGDFPHQNFGGMVKIAPAPSVLTLLAGRPTIARHERMVFWRVGRDARISPVHRAIYWVMTRFPSLRRRRRPR